MACIDQYKAAKSYSVLMVMHAGARAKLQQKNPLLESFLVSSLPCSFLCSRLLQ